MEGKASVVFDISIEPQPHPLCPSMKLFIDTLYAFPPCLVYFFNRSNPLFMAFMASRRKAAAKPTDNHSVQPFLFLISPFPFKSPPFLPLCVSFSSLNIYFSPFICPFLFFICLVLFFISRFLFFKSLILSFASWYLSFSYFIAIFLFFILYLSSFPEYFSLSSFLIFFYVLFSSLKIIALSLSSSPTISTVVFFLQYVPHSSSCLPISPIISFFLFVFCWLFFASRLKF